MINIENKIEEILANNIVYYRLKNNWSQEEFAEKIGSGSNYISELENGKRNARIKFIGKIADAFGIEIYELFIERPRLKKQRKKRDKR